MSRLKKLSSSDLERISDEFGLILESEVSKVISSKEVEDIDLDIIINYDNDQLDVDVDLGVLLDELSDADDDLISQAVDEAYLRFDLFIDDNFRV